MIYHKIELKNADSLRLHYPISYRRKLSTPVQITVEDNEVHMLAHLEFSPKLLKRYVNREPKKGEEASKDLQLEAKGEDFTFADAVCEGIERNWTGSFVFPWLKNGLNGRFKVVTKIVRKDKDKYEPGQRFAYVRFAPFFFNTSFVMSPFWRWIWGLFYCGSPESFTLNWSPSFPGSINMKRYKNLYRFEQVSAHEFGHVLGIGDAYDAPYRFFYQLPDVTSYMMCFNRKVQDQEIDMVLRAHLTRRMQYFPYKFEPRVFFKGIADTFKR